MSVSAFLFQLLIRPLELIFEISYYMAVGILNNSGLAIIVLSLIVNILVLPLYKSADSIQEKERLRQKRMESYTSHIKETFSGDEKMMVLQTYYRQNNYKPIYALSASLPLLLHTVFPNPS